MDTDHSRRTRGTGLIHSQRWMFFNGAFKVLSKPNSSFTLRFSSFSPLRLPAASAIGESLVFPVVYMPKPLYQNHNSPADRQRSRASLKVEIFRSHEERLPSC